MIADVTSLLGHNRIAEEISNKIISDQTLLFLTGPSGVGKSKGICTKVRALLKEQQVTPIYCCADENLNVVDLHPFESLIFARKSLKHEQENTKKGVGKLIDGITNTKFVSAILETTSSDRIDRTLSLKEGFSKKEIAILLQLNSICLNAKSVLILDHFIWLDKASLKLVDYILRGKHPEQLDALNELTILAVVTDEHLEKQSNFSAHSLFKRLQNQNNTFSVGLPNRSQSRQIIELFGIKSPLKDEEYDLIFDISRGHLEVLKIISSCLKDDSSITVFSNEDFEFEAKKIYTLSLGIDDDETGIEYLKKLGMLSALGDSFSYNQMYCLINSSGKNLSQSELNLASKSGILIAEEDTVSFCHEFHRNTLTNFVSNESKSIHAQVSACLEKIIPSQYALRGYHLKMAGESEKAGEYFVLDQIKRLRISANKDASEACVINTVEHATTLEHLTRAYKLFHLNKFDDAALELEGIGIGLPILLEAERDYLLSVCLIEKHNRTDVEYAISILNRWNDLYHTELEIWARLFVAKIQAHVLIGELNTAKQLEAEFSRSIAIKSITDQEILNFLHIQNRKAAAIKISEIAERNIKMALNYFEKQSNGTSLGNLVELYKCWVNYSAVLLNRGKYSVAIDECKKCFQFLTNNKNISFQRRDVIANNFVVASFRSGQMSIEQAVENQIKIAGSLHCADDNHIHRSNLVGYLLIQGDLKKAFQEIHSLEEEIERCSIDESYILYNFINNQMMFHLINGHSKEFEGKLAKLNEVIADSNWPAKHLIEKRIKLIEKKSHYFLGKTYDKIELEILSEEHSTSWQFYGHPITLCELQFWASS